jgi:predicted DnaQ family exonuclease/DinG family helicase
MKSLFNYIALDIETTGFDFLENEIIEIGAVKYTDSKPIEKFSVFVKPKKKVPQFIKQLTHITDEQLTSGETLKNALTLLKEFLRNDIIVCHNTSFDIGFINTKLGECGYPILSNQTIDTLTLSRIYLPYILNHKLETVAKYLKVSLENAHRAIFDAEATGSILIKLLDFIDENISLQLNNKLLEIAGYTDLSLYFFLEKIVAYQQKHALLSKKKSKIDFHSRNYISHKPESVKDYTISDIFQTNGVFEKKIENYEVRNGQIQMAEAVLETFQNDEYLLVEAGTGVGKSLAYLIPAIFHSNSHNTKVVISSNTKNLQEQLFYKDLPTVKECLEVPFKVALLKGRRNYICERKWQENIIDLKMQFSTSEAISLMNLVVWKEYTKTGDISENSSFNLKRNGSVWKKLVADRHFCYGKKCPYFSRCYLMDIRKKAEKSNLVIINHYLLLADILSEYSALGKYDNLIIDEAHNLPHIAPNELGLSLTYADFNSFFSQLFSIRNKFQSGILVYLKTAAAKSKFNQQEHLVEKIKKTIELIKDNKEIFSEFFKKIGEFVDKNGNYGKLRIRNLEDLPFITEYLGKIIIFWENFSKIIMSIKDLLTEVNSSLLIDYEKHMDNIDGIQQRISEFYNGMISMYNPDLKEYAYWLESFKTADENYPNGILNYAPLNINQILNDKLYANVKSIVFTSATLAIRGIFKYYSNRMGLDLLEKGYVQELVVDSPFDYKKQTMILVAGFLPEPKDRFFPAQSIELIKKAIEVSQAGTMVLFTSYKDLNNGYEEVSEDFYSKNILLLAQDKGMGRTAILNEFRENKKAVLLGTNSFWEGVDIPGESLELLVLYKLPFLAPTEPIVEAYLEKLQAEGKDSFMFYMLPNALLKYRQGFGRLIRNKTDKGVVLVLDNRILTKRYGHYFKDIVPANTIITSSVVEILDHLGRWFKGF